MYKIGVFDSGIGGRAIADQLALDYPAAEILYVNDRAHVPYGSRSVDDIIALTQAAIQPLLQASCDVIVIACNTATAAAIETLREAYPDTPFVGLEPMIKTAVEKTKSGVIAVCATPFTLTSDRYRQLNKKFAQNTTVIEPDCHDWAFRIEHNQLNRHSINQIVDQVCTEGADVIVLACTHYHWIKKEIIHSARGRALVIDPSEALSSRVGHILGNQKGSLSL